MFIQALNTDDHPEVTEEYLGLIPMFFHQAVAELPSANEPIEAVAERMDQLYGFGGFAYPMDGTVDENGTYKFPGDPDLRPYGSLFSRGYTCHVYPYGIVAIVRDNGDTKICRMD